MNIAITKLLEAGYGPAMLGLSLSHEQDEANMPTVAQRLINPKLQDSHKKFLRQIITWWDIWLPRELWVHVDTYKVGVEKQSGSTVYNLLKRAIVTDDFLEGDIEQSWVDYLNELREARNLKRLKRHLPEGYMQRRVLMCSYQAVQHIVTDRKHHKMDEWQMIIELMVGQLDHQELIVI